MNTRCLGQSSSRRAAFEVILHFDSATLPSRNKFVLAALPLLLLLFPGIRAGAIE
jgi:hypothetical protein